MRTLVLMLGAVVCARSACCTPIILPSLPSVACHDSSAPATWHSDRYTPAGFENVGGIFGMASLVAVNPLICDFRRSRRFGDEFPYYEPPGIGSYAYPGTEPPPPGLYAWLYVPEFSPGGVVRSASSDGWPLDMALTGLSMADGAIALYDSFHLLVLAAPESLPVHLGVPRFLDAGRMIWYAPGLTAAFSSPGGAAIFAGRRDADRGIAPAAARLDAMLGEALAAARAGAVRDKPPAAPSAAGSAPWSAAGSRLLPAP